MGLNTAGCVYNVYELCECNHLVAVCAHFSAHLFFIARAFSHSKLYLIIHLGTHLLVVFGHLEANVVALLIHNVNLVVQVFAKILFKSKWKDLSSGLRSSHRILWNSEGA